MRGLLLAALLLLTSCVAPALKQADTAVEERLQQVEQIVGDVQSDLDATVRDTTERIERESSEWRGEAGLWRIEFGQLREEVAQTRIAFQSEAQETRRFVKEEVPVIGREVVAEAIGASGAPLKRDEEGKLSLDWAALLAGLAAFASTWGKSAWRRVKGLRMVNGDLERAVDEAVSRRAEAAPSRGRKRS